MSDETPDIFLISIFIFPPFDGYYLCIVYFVYYACLMCKFENWVGPFNIAIQHTPNTHCSGNVKGQVSTSSAH